MKNCIDDGGPAFPQLSVEACARDGHGDLLEPFTSAHGGMTLRDWFAGMAMQGLIQSGEIILERKQWTCANAYLYADAMLAARRQR